MGIWLRDRLRSSDDAPAIAWRGDLFDYRYLGEQVNRWVAEMNSAGLEPGSCVAVIGDFSPGVAALFVASLQNHIIISPLPRSIPDRVPWYLETARAEAVADFTSSERPEFVRLGRTRVHPLQDRLRSQGSAGLVLFSSGTTGDPKASLLNLDVLVERFVARRNPKRVLAFLQMDHIGGVNTFFAFLSSGGLLVFPSSRDPDAICSLVEAHRIQILPVTPTFLRMLLMTEAHRRYDLSSLETLTFGTEPMPAGTLQELRRLFPELSFRQTYGLTELGILPVETDEADPLWLRLKAEEVETRIQDGTLWVRTRTAMVGYLNAEQPFDSAGWFNTQDVVETDGTRIRILGRDSDLINVGGEKVYPREVEEVLLEMEGVLDAGVFGKPSPMTGQVVAARVWLKEPREPAPFGRELRRFCQGRLAAYQIPLFIEVVNGPLHGDRFEKSRRPEHRPSPSFRPAG